MTEVIKVLVIDDEDAIQSIITAFVSRFLSEKGLQANVKGLTDSVQALFELSTSGNQYKVILLDVRLPKLTGDQIYNSLIHVNPELLDRVIFVTGYADDLTDRFSGYPLNILTKPFHYQDFVEQVNRVLKLD